jgi:iron complex outermembrane recepter protein
MTSITGLMSASALCTAAFLTLSTTAHAQSTGTQEVEKVTVTGQRDGTGGVIRKEERPKTRSTVTETYIKTQPAGQTIFQTLNLVPGLNFTNSDPYGSSGGNVRIRGFDGNRISLTQDGIPLNDTGNYAIFTNQQIDPEYIQRATVNTGTTDVDSPTASATGGTINVVTRKPYADLTLSAGTAFGSFNYQRFIGVIDSGEYNGTSAFAGVSFQEYEKFKGPGELQKTQGNARIYQKIGENSFVSLIGHYNENRNNFYRNLTKAQIATFGDSFDNFATCTRDAANGVVGVDGLAADNVQNDGIGPLAAPPGGVGTDNILNPSSCTNFYNLRINPSNTGNMRVQANLALTDKLRLTIDPSWQYVKANGGGTTVVSETDRRLIPLGVAGTFVDLNGDGDGADQIRTYSPNNTNTSRYGVTASLIWGIDENSLVRVAYTGDHGRHRQTGAFGQIYADGTPLEIFGGLDNGSVKINGLDGSFLRGRDRLSHAILNQVSANYTGRFFDNRLLVDVGLRAPYFSRDLNQYCYTQAGTSNVRCTTEPFSDPDGDNIGQLASQGATRFMRPFSTSFEYDAVLPNLGVSYNVTDENVFYFSYAEGLSAPRTDNLYFAAIARTALDLPNVAAADANVVGDEIDTTVFPGVQPEKTKAYDLGYRFQGDAVTASAALWYSEFENRIVTSFDAEAGVNVDRNVGNVVLKGVDAELGWRATPELMLYASGSYIQSELMDDISIGRVAGPPVILQFLPTKGKELVETPNWTFAGRVQYTLKNFSIGLQGKYVGDRFATDINDEVSSAYTVFDANLVVDLEPLGLKSTFLQFNATNIFDKRFLGSISSTNNATTIDVDPGPGVSNRAGLAPTYSVGAPQTFQAQLKTLF